MKYVIALFIVIQGAWTAAALADPVLVTKERYLSTLAQSWESFEVCEYRTRKDRKAFFLQRLGLSPAAIERIAASQEIVLRKDAQSRGYHLGIVELHLTAVGDAALQPAAKPRYMAGTKILTRYVVLRHARRALVVYSESHLDAAVTEFLDGLSQAQGTIWD